MSDMIAIVGEIQVTSYMSYRDFLQDIYAKRKEIEPHYSYARYGVDLGFSLSNVMWLVVAGRRKLSAQGVKRIINALGLTKTDRLYFEYLVKHNNARTPEQQEKFMNKLVALKEVDLGSHDARNHLQYLSEWYHPVLREMIGLKYFNPDPKWISQQLPMKVLPKQIRQSLALLINLGLITHDANKNTYSVAGGNIWPDQNLGKIGAIRYHQRMIQLGYEAITRVDEKKRDINAMTVRLPSEGMAEAKSILIEALQKIFQLEEKYGHAEAIFQVNTQLFPLTQYEDEPNET
jgi:uncharacterized protein (TIGR02147 family)